MSDQPNGAAPVTEAAPEKPKPKPCLYCRKVRCMDPTNFTIPSGEAARMAGCWRGPICDDCRQRAADGDIKPTWDSPPDPESKRAVSITVADADATIHRILSWTAALPNLKWVDFRRGTNALRDYRLSPKEAEEFSNKKFALADAGFTDDRYFELSRLNEYDRALTTGESIGLQSGILRACMRRRKQSFTDFSVDEIEDAAPKVPEPEVTAKSEAESLVEEFRARCDEYMTDAADDWDEDVCDAKKRELTRLAYRIGTVYVTMGEGPKGDWFSKHATSLIEASETLRG